MTDSIHSVQVAGKPCYRHTPDMGEISGFGGGYESLCQDMLESGCNWLVANPKPNLKGRGYQSVYGIMVADSDEAKAMEKAVLDAAKNDCTGAMHQAVMSRLFYIARAGWDDYCATVRSSVA